MQNVLVGKRYRLTEKIGSGGMADVYKAIDETLGRTVAVKLMHTQLSHDPSFTARFQQEAKAAANLQSPYIVNIYDWGAETLSDGSQLYYIVMEYVRGEDLKSVIRRAGALPSGKVAEIGAMVCAALSVAHGYDIIHRDIKPHNIMALPDGNIKVMDFGIARAGNTQMTQTGSVLGSAHYVSPEQAQGRDLTAASDLYSLGIVLYEASTGRMPFDGDSPVAIALKQVQEQAVRPTSINPNIDPSLEQVIGFAMAKDPRARYATADTMRRDLIHVARGEPIVGAHGNMDDDATQVMGGVVPLGGRRDAQDIDGTTIMPAIDAEDMEPAYPLNPRRGVTPPPEKNKAWIWVAVILALIAAAGIIAWQQGLFEPRPEEIAPEIVYMPNVTEITEDAARERLLEEGIAIIVPEVEEGIEGEDAGEGEEGEEAGTGSAILDSIADLTPPEPNLELIVIEKEYSSTIPDGYVIRQRPAAGTELTDAANTEVTLVISSGAELFEVPNLVGMTLDEARRAVEDYEFEIAYSTEHNDDVPAGQIISQSPDAGTEREEGAAIRVIVSEGIESVAVPDVRTMTRAQAENELTTRGFRVTVNEVFSDDIREGVVIDQNPRDGAMLQRGSSVEITVSLGQEQITVPNVVNMREAEATSALTDLGLRVRIIHAQGEMGIVLETNPRSGQRVTPNTEVAVTVGTGIPDPDPDPEPPATEE